MPDNKQSQQFLIPNTTQVPDVLIDHLMAELSGAEFKVMMYITRRTYGFKKYSDHISLTQLLSGITKDDGEVLDRGTGLSRSTLVAALKTLQDKELILAEKRSSAEKGFETTAYSLNFNAPLLQTLVRKPNYPPQFENRTSLVRKSNQQHPVRQHPERNLSSIREGAPKNEKKNGKGQGSQPVLEASLTESANTPRRFSERPKLREESREVDPPDTGESPKLSRETPLRGLTRQYLEQAKAQGIRQTNPQGLVSLASVLPNPPTAKRTYSEERQVLVDVIADLAREFRDEATLTESVSRAYNLMGKAGIKDIGVFTGKIYEARAITKERYGSIKRGRMPYFFSVLSDVCGQRIKPEIKPDAAG